MQAYFGYINKNPEMIMSQFEKNSGNFSVRTVLEVPTVTTVIHAGNNNNLLNMTVTDDRKEWVAVQ